MTKVNLFIILIFTLFNTTYNCLGDLSISMLRYNALADETGKMKSDQGGRQKPIDGYRALSPNWLRPFL